MNYSQWCKQGGVLAALAVTALLAAAPARAQNPAVPAAGADRNRPLAIDVDQVGLPDKIVADLNDVLVARLHDPADELLGATLRPVGDTLRAQLGIPAGRGLLVAALRGDGPSAQAGLQQNDVLLSLADKPLAAPDDLAKCLKAAGEAPVPLKVLRAGKPVTLQVRPVYRVTLGPVAEQKTEYYIGVSVDPVDDALRSQLGLSADQGVVISEVVSASPAEKAGVKKHDVVVEMSGKPIGTFEALAHEVQAARDQPTTLKVLRGGKTVTIPITGAVRNVEASAPQEAFRLLLLDQQAAAQAQQLSALNAAHGIKVKETDVSRRLDHLEMELKALRAAVDRLNETLKGNKRD
jgi:membrane-associated protease RseP (regulator of RpoE activity)